jgi:threonine dehydratase
MTHNIVVDSQYIAEISSKVLEANHRIASYVVRTPLELCSVLGEMFGAQVYLKCEHLQHTGSFKLRGAVNKLICLKKTTNGSKLNVIAASTGNHGLAVAYAAKLLDIYPTVYLPQSTSSTKQSAIKSLGATVVLVEGDCVKAEIEARSQSEVTGYPYISPYNDIDVIVGQGTIGYEINQQLDDIDAVFVSIGGGGLISGIAAYLKSVNANIRIVGCWPENAPSMLECLQAGKMVQTLEKPTLSTGTAGGVEQDSITFPLCQKLIDDYVCVSEDEIAQGIRLIAEHEHWLVEGAAAVAVSSFMKVGARYHGKKVAIVLCGRNLSLEQLKQVLK